MDSDQLNYLTILKPSVFKHLFKFLSDKDVQKAKGVCRWDVEAFKEHSTDENVGECALFEVCNARRNSDTYLGEGGSFIDDQREEMDLLRDSIQHLAFTSNCVMLDRSTYDYLLEYLTGSTEDGEDSENSGEEDLQTLKSLHVCIKRNEGVHLDDSFSQRPSWFRLMAKLNDKKHITATLVVAVHPELLKSVSRTCDLLSIPDKDPFCQHINQLIFLWPFLEEKTIYENKPELTAHPIASFLAKLPVLQYLMISASDLNNTLLWMFTMRSQNTTAPPLKTLFIYASNSFRYLESHGPFPEISDDTWVGFANAYPNLQLELLLMPVCSAADDDIAANNATTGNAARAEAEPSAVVEGPDQRRLDPARTPETSGRWREAQNSSNARSATTSPSTAVDIMNTVLKRRAPLVNLMLMQITAQQFNNVVNKCQDFCSTLQTVRVEKPIGNIGDFHFQGLTSGMFTMREIESYGHPETQLTKHIIF